MCYNPKFTKNEPSLEEIKREIDGIDKFNSIYLTGGEPTIRPDILDIIYYIKKKNDEAEINIFTNGRMFYYYNFAKKIVNSGVFKYIIPLHGSKPEVHDRVTKVPGSFRQTVKGIENLLILGARVDIRIVTHKLNYIELPNIAKFISNFLGGIDSVIIFPIDIIGDAYINREKVVATYTQIAPYVEKAIDILNENQFVVKLFHIPFCVIGKKYWSHLKGVTTEDVKLASTTQCKKCTKRGSCPKIWKSYAKNIGTHEFKPIF
jgi:MoaA/NifB/PqqE/SkfB family radical SAM enzyme